MQKVCNRAKPSWFIALMMLALPVVVNANALEQAISTQVDADLAAQKSQQQVESLSDETQAMLYEYRDVLRQTESLKAYNDQLEKLVQSQNKELTSIDLQLRNIETTQRDIVPLMLKMIDVMAQFVELDLPFFT
jgi:hypothetical protein